MNLSLKKKPQIELLYSTFKKQVFGHLSTLTKKLTPSNISYLIQYGKLAKKENKITTCIQKLQELTTILQSLLSNQRTTLEREVGQRLKLEAIFF